MYGSNDPLTPSPFKNFISQKSCRHAAEVTRKSLVLVLCTGVVRKLSDQAELAVSLDQTGGFACVGNIFITLFRLLSKNRIRAEQVGN